MSEPQLTLSPLCWYADKRQHEPSGMKPHSIWGSERWERLVNVALRGHQVELSDLLKTSEVWPKRLPVVTIKIPDRVCSERETSAASDPTEAYSSSDRTSVHWVRMWCEINPSCSPGSPGPRNYDPNHPKARTFSHIMITLSPRSLHPQVEGDGGGGAEGSFVSLFRHSKL